MVDLPLTAVEDPFLEDCNPIEEALILVGLGRPFAGNFQHILIGSHFFIFSLSFQHILTNLV